MPSRVVRARLDPASEAALRLLTGGGRTESEVVRAALVDAGDRRRQRSSLAQEVLALAADAQDREARRAAAEDMDAVASDWPE